MKNTGLYIVTTDAFDLKKSIDIATMFPIQHRKTFVEQLKAGKTSIVLEGKMDALDSYRLRAAQYEMMTSCGLMVIYHDAEDPTVSNHLGFTLDLGYVKTIQAYAKIMPVHLGKKVDAAIKEGKKQVDLGRLSRFESTWIHTYKRTLNSNGLDVATYSP